MSYITKTLCKVLHKHCYNILSESEIHKPDQDTGTISVYLASSFSINFLICLNKEYQLLIHRAWKHAWVAYFWHWLMPCVWCLHVWYLHLADLNFASGLFAALGPVFSTADFRAFCTSAKMLKWLSSVALPGTMATTKLAGLKFFFSER